jgi:hypothetical protein
MPARRCSHDQRSRFEGLRFLTLCTIIIAPPVKKALDGPSQIRNRSSAANGVMRTRAPPIGLFSDGPQDMFK